jgi:hypothetical protein
VQKKINRQGAKTAKGEESTARTTHISRSHRQSDCFGFDSEEGALLLFVASRRVGGSLFSDLD